MRLLHWLVEAPLPHVVGAAGGLVTAMVGDGLCIRQGQLATHQVCVAATEQLKQGLRAGAAGAVQRARRAHGLRRRLRRLQGRHRRAHPHALRAERFPK